MWFIEILNQSIFKILLSTLKNALFKNHYYFVRNIFIALDGHLKLGDLGLARSFDEDSSSVFGEAYTFAGSIAYMSPEIIDGCKYSFSVDIWSSGCVIFEIFTLKKYFTCFKNMKENENILDALVTSNTFNQLLKL